MRVARIGCDHLDAGVGQALVQVAAVVAPGGLQSDGGDAEAEDPVAQSAAASAVVGYSPGIAAGSGARVKEELADIDADSVRRGRGVSGVHTAIVSVRPKGHSYIPSCFDPVPNPLYRTC